MKNTGRIKKENSVPKIDLSVGYCIFSLQSVQFSAYNLLKNNTMKISKKSVIEYAKKHQDIVENGIIHVYANASGELTHTIGSQEYRDNNHVLIASFNIWNESKPYTYKALEFQYHNH